MLIGLLLVIQILISIAMVVAILLQSSKGGGLAGIAGGLSSSTVFGGRSAANFLTRATTVLATLFFINCLGMAMITAHSEGMASVTQQAVAGEAPASPVPSIPGGQTINVNAEGGDGQTAPAATQEVDPAMTPTAVEPQPEKTEGEASDDGN